MLLTASVCLSICPSVCLPIYLYVCKSIQARLSVSPLLYSSDSVYLYVRLSADCLSICLAVNRSRLMLRSVGLSFRPSACLSVCLAVHRSRLMQPSASPVFPSVSHHLPISLSAYLSVNLPICPTVHAIFHAGIPLRVNHGAEFRRVMMNIFTNGKVIQ